MDRRTHEGPMDFEYQNGTGPMDGRSPFAQISMNSRYQANNDKKRSWVKFEQSSPSKPSLREPAANHPHFFDYEPSKALPPVPLHKNPLFNTPRKLDVSYDVESSGGETPKSPEHRDVDSDAATPDTTGMRSRFAILDTTTKPEFRAGGGGGRTSPTKDERTGSRRQSWFSRTMSRMSPLSTSPSIYNGINDTKQRSSKGTSSSSSSGGGAGHHSSRNEYSHAAERKIIKKRNNTRQQALASRRISISDDEDDSSAVEDMTPDVAVAKSSRKGANKLATTSNMPPPPPPHATDAQKKDGPHWLYTFFQFLTNHPTLPHILSFYAQLLLNLFVIGGVMYLLYSFWATIRADVDKKSYEAVSELLAQMAVCAQHYTDNKCERSTRVPGMENACNEWEKCMNQNPKNVGRARVSAHTFAEIFNSFIEPISYKAMFFCLLIIFGSVAISNFAFSIFRDKTAAAQQHANAQHHHYYGGNGLLPPPPPTPQREFSAGDAGAGNGGYWTPYHGLEPAPSLAYNNNNQDAEGSPVRRLQFR
ncbi:hypothetical protein AAFC00_005964 [Neodothiora populina]|uniref:Brl1/Brr6 domain-containing protein n=1 Tax=Neodothiora populina TaxID=2781224 RepID=A0ABR3P6I1_9PEZI